MTVLAPPVQVVASGAPPFVHVPSGAPPFVVTTGPAPPITIVTSGAPPITLFNEDGSLWAGGSVPVGGAGMLVGETDGFATDFLYATDANRVSLKAANTTTNYAVDAFYQQAGTSPKMVYDVAGTLGWSPHNTCLQSQTFDNAAWTKTLGTVSANAIAAPDGTTTADTWIPNSGLVDNHLSSTIAATNGVVNTFSVYMKNGTLGNNWFQFVTTGFAGLQAWFNLATGAKGASTGSPVDYTITSVGSGWYRVTLSFLAVAASGTIYLAPRNADSSGVAITGNGTSPAFYPWGAQVNLGSTALAYLPTTTAARVGLALDYDPVTHAAKGLLCEPAATNLITRSNDLSFLSADMATMTLDNQVGPDGLLTADTLTENTAVGTHSGYGNSGFTANIDHTVSRFYKMGTRRYATIGWADGTNGAYGVYDLQSGVVGSSAAFGTGVLNSASIQALPNGWYRCILSGKVNASTVYYTFGMANAATITPDGFGRQSFLGTGATLFLGHYQVETGTVATSPIPTTTAQVTRAADQVSVTPASINYSATAGSWWVDVSMNIAGDGSSPRVIGYQASANTPIYVDTTQFGIYDGNLVTKIIPSTLGAHKAAMAFASADRAITADGLAVSTNTAAGIALGTPGTAIGFGSDPNGAPYMTGYIRKLRYLPRRPTNAELQTMTATVPYAGTIAAQVMVTAAAASTGASASFTPPANSTLVAFVSARGGTSATATTLTDSLGSVWVKIGDYLGPNATAFVVTGVYALAIGPSPVAMTVTGGSTVTGTSMGSGCQVISCTGSIGPLSNTQAGQSGVGSVSLTVSGVSVLTYYVRQTTASTIVIPTGYTELGGAHIQYNNMTASVAYDLTSPGNQSWTGGGNAIAWSGEISG